MQLKDIFSFKSNPCSFPRVWDGLSPDQEKYLIQIRPPGDVISWIIRDVVIAKAITALAVIHDDTIGVSFFLSFFLSFFHSFFLSFFLSLSLSLFLS
jgi:hypothetical protein